MRTCEVESCDKQYFSRGYCRKHYYENMKKELGENYKKNIKYEKSLEYFAKQNNKEYLLSEYSDKNEVNPSGLSKGSDKICWWNCSKCKSEYDMSVTRRTRGRGSNCPYCVGQRVNHTNCLWTTHPEIAKLLKNPQRGFEITSGRNEKEDFVCPDCKDVSEKKMNNVINQGYSCLKCSDGLSYPEKFMMNILSQLKLDFETQRIFNWSRNKRYDFYIKNINCIIETHGLQHYEESSGNRRGISLDAEQENDRIKENLARDNGITNYIIIDARKSELEYIKNSIVNGEFSNLLNFENVNWTKAHEYACNTLIKTVCDIWNNKETSTVEIGKVLKLSYPTIRDYLKRGVELDWCEYDPKEIHLKNAKKANKSRERAVFQLSIDGDFIKEYSSATEAANHVNISRELISAVCRGRKGNNTGGGFKWVYK